MVDEAFSTKRVPYIFAVGEDEDGHPDLRVRNTVITFLRSTEIERHISFAYPMSTHEALRLLEEARPACDDADTAFLITAHLVEVEAREPRFITTASGTQIDTDLIFDHDA